MTRPDRPRPARRAPRFDALEARTLLSADPAHTLLVRFDAGVPAVRRDALLRSVRATVVESIADGPFLVALGPRVTPAAAIGRLEASGSVAYAERGDASFRVASISPSDPLYPQQWGLNNPGGVDIDAPAAWGITTGNPSTIIAVIDSGIVTSHPEFAGRLWTGPNGIHGWNFITNTANIQDNNGHGTHVAGILGASANNGLGIAGVNWSAKLMILKTIDASGLASIPATVKAIHYAVDHGARVINASWDGADADPALVDAINYAGAHNVVVVVAAGNESSNDDTTPTYPASIRAANEISVAAIDRNGNLASFSNYGTGTVAIAAPGVGILSTYLGNGYTSLDGTSMATPFVTGVIALVAGLHPEDSAAQLIQAVTATARPLPSLAGMVTTGGIVDAAAALNHGVSVASTPTPVSTPATAPLATADVHAQLLGVPEYFTQAGGTDAAFVQRLYQTLLGRDAEPAGLIGWVARIQAGESRQQVARDLESTPEALQTEVARWYQADLGRPNNLEVLKADPGLQSWVALLQQGLSPEAVHAQLLGVPEYFTQAGGTDAAFVQRLYQTLLGRDAEPAGLIGWVARIQAGESRQQVARDLESTPEALQTEVARWYQADLGRPNNLEVLKADPGLQTWVALLS